MKLIRLYLTLILVSLVSMVAEATGTSYYYKVTAKAEATGRGFIYASDDTERGPWLFRDNNVSARLNSAESNSESKTVYLTASPFEGYALEKWTDSIGTTVASASNNNFSYNGNTVSSQITYTLIAPSTSISAPTANVFTAHFVDTYVSVFSANNDLCAVSIDNPINSARQTVKLTATPKAGVTFLGWRKKGSATILSTQQSNWPVTATSTKTTYEAVFRYAGSPQEFVRMQSGSEQSKYLSLVQDDFNYTNVVKAAPGYTGLTTNDGKAKALAEACNYLSKDISLNESVYDPGQVLFHNTTEKNVYAQGTNVGYITKGYSCHHGGSTTVGVEGVKLGIDAQKINYDSYSRLTMNPTVSYSGATYSLGNIFIVNKEGAISVEQTANTSDNYKWTKKTINGATQYFAFNPTIQDTKTGMYYTTLRTSFSYKIKNPDKVTAYEINEVANGGTAILTPFEPDEVIPGDLAVVLESSSQEPTDNILLPWNLDYTKNNSVLFNKYGHRLHCYTGTSNSGDQYDACTEGGIGYFEVPYNSSKMGNMYKLSVNEAGEVGFWTKVTTSETVSGNKGYSTVPCGLFKYAELKDLPETADQYTYKITNPLTVAYVDVDAENSTIYAKDEDGTVTQSKSGDEIDFMAVHYPDGNYGDGNYSNWVGIKVTSLPTSVVKGAKLKNVTGKIVDTNNPTIQCKTVEVDGSGKFTPKTYSIANFSGSPQYSTPNNHPFFFATPKANEICDIVWAEYDDDGTSKTFNVPVTDAGLSGSVNADFSLYPQTPQTSTVYKFLGLVLKTPSSKAASTGYTVYPLEQMTNMGDTSVPTGISNVNTGNVVSVKYYNAMGVESSVPFNGVNIVVTTYDNGTRSTSKVIR